VGQGFSKNWFIAAQFGAYLSEGHWLELARHANMRAVELARAIEASPKARLAYRPDGNEIFAILDGGIDAKLREAGAVFHPWAFDSLPPEARPGAGEVLVRLIANWQTRAEEVAAFAEALSA
jgi:threonine aldolase